MLFKLKDVELVAQLIQGTFPDYSRLIPKEWGSRAVVEVRDFLQETKIASIFARDGSGIVRITFQNGEDGAPGQMTVSARAEEIGDNTGALDAAVEGEASKIAFNGKYLAGSAAGARWRPRRARDHRPVTARRHPPHRQRQLRPRCHADVRPVVAVRAS